MNPEDGSCPRQAPGHMTQSQLQDVLDFMNAPASRSPTSRDPASRGPASRGPVGMPPAVPMPQNATLAPMRGPRNTRVNNFTSGIGAMRNILRRVDAGNHGGPPPPYPEHQPLPHVPMEHIMLNMLNEAIEDLLESNFRQQTEIDKVIIIVGKMNKAQKKSTEEIKRMNELLEQAHYYGYGLLAVLMLVALICAALVGVATTVVQSGK
ncbi:hypothetical protein BKA67DRAFT_656343 [Truncatella angustata]|uniref:Uncharacterized protein n=1 Tax=Truncatella angustata TaxID=152316 RepID=A0A9P8UTC1_9PEZI|nr:uncharacterized protein BKA67DRAFT_656343 [Truncatella angustata]KAH6658122.1 hypothetical protein BKA67DRAFT_656343 [Truncatella angustata]